MTTEAHAAVAINAASILTPADYVGHVAGRRVIFYSRRGYFVVAGTVQITGRRKPVRFGYAYSATDGSFIGPSKVAYRIWRTFAIVKWLCRHQSKTASVGETSDGAWVGWSHRAAKRFKSREAAEAFAESVS